ncbi:MAG: RluA family pseudouridine synthase [Bacteroidota bacterium]
MSFEKQVLYEDNHLLIVNKKSGELVQGDRTGDATLMDRSKAYIKEKYNKPGEVFLGLPHRLDRPTSGILVMCRTSKALSRMTKIFKDRDIKKKYWAIVGNETPAKHERLEHRLLRNQKQNKSYVHQGNNKEAKTASLEYAHIGSSDRYHLLEIELHTGRHHQIRAQLAHIGCPIKGDLKYGFSRSNKDGSISLHARTISFEHPVKKELIDLTARPPKDSLWDFFEKQHR